MWKTVHVYHKLCDTTDGMGIAPCLPPLQMNFCILEGPISSYELIVALFVSKRPIGLKN